MPTYEIKKAIAAIDKRKRELKLAALKDKRIVAGPLRPLDLGTTYIPFVGTVFKNKC